MSDRRIGSAAHYVLFLLPALSAACCPVPCSATHSSLSFRMVSLDENVGKVCYALTHADVDGDGDEDIIALTENRVLCFDNPSWSPSVLLADAVPPDHVCIAPCDIDGDGRVDFALGAGWTKIGTLHWMTRSGAAEGTWQVHTIGGERWLHRMRFADVLGTGKPQLVISPLNASQDDAAGVRLTAFTIPADPVADRWQPTVLNQSLNRMHNHEHTDALGDGSMDTLTASREGLHLISVRDGKAEALRIGTGIEAEDVNQSGCGEVRIGRLGDGRRFIVTVEPMHGHSVAVYMQPDEGSRSMWHRSVIADGFQRGHALAAVDMDGDGDDEIIFGHSDTPDSFGVIMFDRSTADGQWTRQVVDAGGVAVEDLKVRDFNGDGLPDIVAGGRSTHNVRLFLQQLN